MRFSERTHVLPDFMHMAFDQGAAVEELYRHLSGAAG